MTSVKAAFGCAVAFCLSCLGAEQTTQLYTFSVPGATSTEARAINDRGDIVGYSWTDNDQHGFLFRDGVFQTVDAPVPNAVSHRLLGINSRGDMVGSYYDPTAPQTPAIYSGNFGFMISSRGFAKIDGPGCLGTVATGINNRGDIIGLCERDVLVSGFLLRNGEFTFYGPAGAVEIIPAAINSAGDIVGIYNDGYSLRSFLYRKGTFSDIEMPGAANTLVRGINERGDIVGKAYFSSTGQYVVFVLSNETFTVVDMQDAASSEPWAIGVTGDIVGSIAGLRWQGFLLEQAPQ